MMDLDQSFCQFYHFSLVKLYLCLDGFNLVIFINFIFFSFISFWSRSKVHLHKVKLLEKIFSKDLILSSKPCIHPCHRIITIIVSINLILTYPSGISPSFCIVKTLASLSLSNPIKLSISKIVSLITYPHFGISKMSLSTLGNHPFHGTPFINQPQTSLSGPKHNPKLHFAYLQNCTLHLHLHNIPSTFALCM